jgi:hypothetical protein
LSGTRFRHTESLYRAANSPRALGELATWLAMRPGREAEHAMRETAAAGDPDALEVLEVLAS